MTKDQQYEAGKRKIERVARDADEYEKLIRELVERLRI